MMEMSYDQLSMNNDEEDRNSADGESVWAPEIETCFHEALKLYPPCGRRKHILQDDNGGKMYGRNELIAKYIWEKTGKMRTRKQVSSHIQVLNRRKHKMDTTSNSAASVASTSSATPSPSSGSSSLGNGNGVQINHQLMHHHSHHQHHLNMQNNLSTNLYHQQHHQAFNNAYNENASLANSNTTVASMAINQPTNNLSQHQQILKRESSIAIQRNSFSDGFYDVWTDRPIVTQKIRLVEFSAFVEHRNFQTPASNIQNQPIIGLTTSTGNGTNGSAQPYQTSLYPNHLSQQQRGHHQLNTTDHFQSQNYQDSTRLSSNQLTPNANVTGVANGHSHQLSTNTHHSINVNNQFNFNNISPSGNAITGNSITTQNNNSSPALSRHCYIQIDYTQPSNRTNIANKLERIDITQIQDKFPEIGGSDGLFQRGPPDSFFLVKFWVDNDFNFDSDQNPYFGFSSHFETSEPYKNITCSTKACSYGYQVVEKVDKIFGTFNNSNGRNSYAINRSPMCEFMIQFIKKLRQLPLPSQMNSVLENFSVLQVITSESTSEILLCLAYVFEIVPTSEHNNGPQYHVYKLARD